MSKILFVFFTTHKNEHKYIQLFVSFSYGVSFDSLSSFVVDFFFQTHQTFFFFFFLVGYDYVVLFENRNIERHRERDTEIDTSVIYRDI